MPTAPGGDGHLLKLLVFQARWASDRQLMYDFVIYWTYAVYRILYHEHLHRNQVQV